MIVSVLTNRMEKRCFKCLAIKPLADFYRHGAMSDKHLNKCKSCTRSAVKLHRQANLESIRAYDRDRHNNDEHRERNKKNYRKRVSDPQKRKKEWQRSREWAEKNKLKRAAHIMVGNAIRSGSLVPKPCERCGTTELVNAHHEDYFKPLDVMWLCKKHHGERHQEINEERRK